MISSAEDIVNEFDKMKNFSIDSIENMIENNEIIINDKLSIDIISSSLKFIHPETEMEQLLTLDDEDKKRIRELDIKKSSIKKMIGEIDENVTNTNSNSNSNNNANNISNINTTNNNTSNIAENNASFSNLSEESQISKLNNSNDNIKKNLLAQINVHNSPVDIKKIQTININTTNTINNTCTLNSINTISVIKMPVIKKEASRSPLKKNELDRDKTAFIKLQFKNESANFTGQGKFLIIL